MRFNDFTATYRLAARAGYIYPAPNLSTKRPIYGPFPPSGVRPHYNNIYYAAFPLVLI